MPELNESMEAVVNARPAGSDSDALGESSHGRECGRELGPVGNQPTDCLEFIRSSDLTPFEEYHLGRDQLDS